MECVVPERTKSVSGVERRWLRTNEAANYLTVSEDHLKSLRQKKRGPAFRKVGRVVLYAIEDLDGWVTSYRPRGGAKCADERKGA